MKIVFFLLFSLSLFSNDISVQHKTAKNISLDKEIDLELTKKTYWDKYLKAIDTKFGYIESDITILTCNKESSTLSLYKKDKNNIYKFKKEFPAFTGKNKGDKTKEGDRKTPIGIYKLTNKLSNGTNLDPFYGPLALVTSYPNTYDRYRGKNGYGIWIHGFPFKEERDDFTRGCIVINNQHIESLEKKIDIQNTLLIIDRDKVQQNISKNILSTILSQLYAWRYSWLYNDIDIYLEFYADGFIRSDGVKIDVFSSYKTRIFKKQEKKIIIFNNINVIPYPNSQNIYQITFKEFYKSQTFQFTGDKTLIVKLLKNKHIKIITEK